MTVDSFTRMILDSDLYRANDPYDPSVSAAIMIPSLYLRPSTDVPVTIGNLKQNSIHNWH